MTKQQLDVLTELFWTGMSIRAIEYGKYSLEGSMEVEYADNGGNLFRRLYKRNGQFQELRV